METFVSSETCVLGNEGTICILGNEGNINKAIQIAKSGLTHHWKFPKAHIGRPFASDFPNSVRV
jgi:hypothetical protein